MIEKLQGAAQIPQSRTGTPTRTASGVTSPAFGSMLQQQMEFRDLSRTQAAVGTPVAQAVQQADIAQAVQQNAMAQAVQQSLAAQRTLSAQAVQQSEPQSRTRQTVNFSKHALARVEERGIEITPDLMGRLADSVEKAQEKGAKNILAFSDSQAFIVNIPYGRVITAMSGEEMRENIFTNIDGAVLL